MRVPLTGTAIVGPAVATFYFDSASSGFTAAVKTFFTSVAATMPTGFVANVPNNGDILTSTTGALSGVWTDGTAGTIPGTAAGTWAEGVGARVVWNTAGVRSGRRVRGSTFLVPLAIGAYEGAGMLQGSTVTLLQNAAQTLATAGVGLEIWSRPHKGLSDGQVSLVTSATAPDAVSWLRSRRT